MAKKSLWRWLIVILLVIIILPCLGAAAWVWGALHIAYSSGERNGFIEKISQRGWVCKTWEGELATTPVPGGAPQIFDFTVRDPAVAQQVTNLMGQRATLLYEQHRYVPTNCFGETEYYITGVKAMPMSPPPPAR